MTNSNKEFVSDQPGLALTFLGIFIALFMGLAFKAAFPQDKVKSLIEVAAKNIRSDLEFQIESANFSLANGILPEIAVRINNIKIISKNDCWMSPQAEIDEIRLPLSFFKLLQGKAQVNRIEIGQVNLLLKDKLKDCQSKPVAETPRQGASTAASTVASAEAQKNNSLRMITHTKSLIETVLIKKLQISYLPLKATTITILDFVANVKSEQPKLIVLRGQLIASQETLSGDYPSNADLYFEYSEAADPVWKSLIGGSWREGRYQAEVDYWPGNHKFQWNLSVKHLPLSQLFPVLKKYEIMQADYNGKQTWLSFSSTSEGSAINFDTAKMDLNNIKIEGDIGVLSSDQVKFTSLKPIQFDPVQIQLQKINISKLLYFLQKPHPSPALSSLGIFDGEATLNSPQQIEVTGEHKGLEFIFSNKGSRELQSIEGLSAKAKLTGKEWTIDLQNIKPADGAFVGQIKIQADRDWKAVAIQTKFDDLKLSKVVQNLMSNQGRIEGLKGWLDFTLNEAQLKSVQGKISLVSSRIENIDLDKTEIGLSTKDKITYIDINSKQASVNKNSPVSIFLVHNLNFSKDEEITFKNLNIKSQTEALNSFKWTVGKAQWGDKFIYSEGGWKNNEELYGYIKVKDKDRESKWNLQGNRFQPKLLKN